MGQWLWSNTRCHQLEEGRMKQVLKRGMIPFKRIQDFCRRHPAFLYKGVLIGRAVLPLEKILNCALTCNLTMWVQQLWNGLTCFLMLLPVFKNFPSFLLKRTCCRRRTRIFTVLKWNSSSVYVSACRSGIWRKLRDCARVVFWFLDPSLSWKGLLRGSRKFGLMFRKTWQTLRCSWNSSYLNYRKQRKIS